MEDSQSNSKSSMEFSLVDRRTRYFAGLEQARVRMKEDFLDKQKKKKAKDETSFKRIRRSFAQYKKAHPQGDLCRRCAGIDWSLLLPREALHYCNERHGQVLFGVPVSSQELSASSCPLCRFLGSNQSFDKESTRRLRVECASQSVRYSGGLCSVSHGERPWTHHAPRLTWVYRGLKSRHAPPAYILQDASTATQGYVLRRLNPGIIDYEILRHWLIHCKRHHSAFCNPTFSSAIPGLRLFDCNAREVIAAPEYPSLRYIALSYVWGGVKISEKEQAGFPATIRDAITVTLELGYRYLWIDQLCIHQSCESHKQAQIKLMGRIYAEAELVIIAASGSSSEFGLPGVSTRPRQVQRRIELDVDLELVEMIDANSTLANSTWATRGWTLQEGYLATRRLVFTNNEVFYVCNAGRWQESVHRPAIEDFDSRRTVGYPGFPLDFSSRTCAAQMLEDYTARKLSVEGDILNACIGVLERLVDHHFWGISAIDTGFSSSFSLEWGSKCPGQRREGFPSWSWVATTGSKWVKLHSRNRAPKFFAEILTTDGRWLLPECHNESRHDSLPEGFGPTLRLTGSFYTAFLVKSRKPSNSQAPREELGEETEEIPFVIFQHAYGKFENTEIALELWVDLTLSDSVTRDTVKAITVRGTANGLWDCGEPPIFMILQAVGDHYERIGITGKRAWIREKMTGLIRKSERSIVKPHPDCSGNEETICIA